MVDTVPQDFQRRPFRQGLSRAGVGETALSSDFLHAHTASSGPPQSPRAVPAP
jgi:hypothetical protein